jgi:hypothetical protein
LLAISCRVCADEDVFEKAAVSELPWECLLATFVAVILRFVGIVPRKIDALTHLLASELLLQIIIMIIIRIMIIMLLSKQINRTSGNYANGTAAYPSGSRSLLLLLLLSSVSSSSGKIPVALELNRVRCRGYTYTTPFVTLKQTFFGSDENYYGFFVSSRRTSRSIARLSFRELLLLETVFVLFPCETGGVYLSQM